MRRISLRAILITFALALVLAPTALAQAKSLYWERYDVDITAQPNGDLRVVENQVIVFTSGVFREGYAELATRNTEGIDDVTVSENGQPYTFESIISNGDEGAYTTEKTDSGNISVIWAMGPTRNTTRSFELAYTVHGAIRRYPEGNEFQWNAISPGLHDFEIRASTVTLHMPSVDVMMTSVAQVFSRRAVGVILTGMGNDGHDGMKAIKAAQGRTIAQDEASCVIYSMPKGVVDSGLADKIVPLDKIAGEIANMV